MHVIVEEKRLWTVLMQHMILLNRGQCLCQIQLIGKLTALSFKRILLGVENKNGKGLMSDVVLKRAMVKICCEYWRGGRGIYLQIIYINYASSMMQRCFISYVTRGKRIYGISISNSLTAEQALFLVLILTRREKSESL